MEIKEAKIPLLLVMIDNDLQRIYRSSVSNLITLFSYVWEKELKCIHFLTAPAASNASEGAMCQGQEQELLVPLVPNTPQEEVNTPHTPRTRSRLSLPKRKRAATTSTACKYCLIKK